MPWVDMEPKAFKGVFKTVPDRADLSQDIDESLVVALYYEVMAGERQINQSK